MKIVLKRVGQEPEVKEIEKKLSVMQSIVDGWVECFNLPNRIVCVCNEEGKLRRLPPKFCV